uniref:Uncharacterized protein n=1 Tax=Avena sativa TaxID=4498 RepID=A0ACD5Y372_AVESA
MARRDGSQYKTQWPKFDHGFFMHPPLLKATTGRQKTERYKGCVDKKKRPTYVPYLQGLWASLAQLELPKKKKKTTKTNKSSIVPCDGGEPTRMCFPLSLSLETTTKKKEKDAKSSAVAEKRKNLEDTNSNKGKKGKCKYGGSKRLGTGSNLVVSLSTKISMPSEQTNVPAKVTAKTKKIEMVTKNPMVAFDSLAMGTRRKIFNPSSPVVSIRSKRRLDFATPSFFHMQGHFVFRA